MKTFERALTVVLLIGSLASLAAAIWSHWANPGMTGRFYSTAGTLLQLAGLFQLEVSGLFSKLLETYGDDDRFPLGPPSSVTRFLTDNPDDTVFGRFRNRIFHEVSTGFWLIVAGTIVQIAGVWT